ncbi:MAG: phosphodiesterase [Mycobacterium sp.]|uniref:phosphodiesterase n=1 Tax=Mycobacterium sp. TaxID=1785 RepID=UPI003C3D28F7
MNLSDVVSTPFRWGSALRHRRIFHPDGVLAEGSIERVAPAHTGLPVASGSVIARVSKAAGTPGALPDAIGLALRIVAQADPNTDWDILLASAGSGRLSRAIGLRPVTSWTGRTMTSLVPLRYRDINWWLRARIATKIDAVGVSLASIRDQLDHCEIEVELDQARGASDFRPLARATLTNLFTPQRGDDVSFDPVRHTAHGVELYPRWLADLRARAYDRSREGREAVS